MYGIWSTGSEDRMTLSTPRPERSEYRYTTGVPSGRVSTYAVATASWWSSWEWSFETFDVHHTNVMPVNISSAPHTTRIPTRRPLRSIVSISERVTPENAVPMRIGIPSANPRNR